MVVVVITASVVLMVVCPSVRGMGRWNVDAGKLRRSPGRGVRGGQYVEKL